MLVRVVDVGRIGIAYGPAKQRVKYRPLAALVASPERCWEGVVDTLAAVRMLVQRRLKLSSLAGPVGIAQLAGRAAKQGLGELLAVVLLISVNLGVLNLLPIPVLDGGHVVLLLAEAARRKPLPARLVLVIQQVGVALLILLMAVVMFHDVRRLVLYYAEEIGLARARELSLLAEKLNSSSALRSTRYWE